jgi:hypothetical protein
MPGFRRVFSGKTSWPVTEHSPPVITSYLPRMLASRFRWPGWKSHRRRPPTKGSEKLEDDCDFGASARKENLELELRFAAPIYLDMAPGLDRF